MSSSRRQQHPARRRARGAVRPDDADPGRRCSPSGTGSSSRRRVPGGRADGRRSSRSRAFIVARSHGEEAATAAEAHFTRVVREGGAPEEVPEAALPDGDPIHLPALLAAAFGLSTSEARRMIGQGGVKLNGDVVTRARPAARGRRGRARAGGEAPVRALRTRRLLDTDAAGSCYSSRAAREGGSRSALSLDTGAALERIGYDLVPNHPWASGASRQRSFCCPTRPASIFENSTAYVKRRGLSSTFRRGRGVTPSVRSRTRRFSRRCRTEA